MVKKEPITSSTSRDPRLATLDIHTASSSFGRTSLKSEEEIEQLENHFQSLQVNIYVYMYIHTHIYIYTQIYKCVCGGIYIYVCVYIYIFIYIHKYIHICI